jgi:hypothetical protein
MYSASAAGDPCLERFSALQENGRQFEIETAERRPRLLAMVR